MSTTILVSVFSLTFSDAIPELRGKVKVLFKFYPKANIKGSTNLQLNR